MGKKKYTQNRRKKVMKKSRAKTKTSIETQMQKFMEAFKDCEPLINITSDNIASEARDIIEFECEYFDVDDEEQRKLIARARSGMEMDSLSYYKREIDDAIKEGRIERGEFVDSVISKIDENYETLNSMWVEAGGAEYDQISDDIHEYV